MDSQVAALTPFGLSKALPLGNVRPRWAAMQSWWDLDADRDLLIGSFLHGFGAYPKMRSDPRLCYSSKVGAIEVTAVNPLPPAADATGDFLPVYSSCRLTEI